MKDSFSSLRRRPYSTPEERARWVRRYNRSGLSQRAFAERHGLGLFTLRKWITQDGKKAFTDRRGKPVWQELKLDGLPGAARWAAEVVRPDGIVVRVAWSSGLSCGKPPRLVPPAARPSAKLKRCARPAVALVLRTPPVLTARHGQSCPWSGCSRSMRRWCPTPRQPSAAQTSGVVGAFWWSMVPPSRHRIRRIIRRRILSNPS